MSLSPKSNSPVGINDLPNEVLEYIISLLPPYKDLKSCMLVCKRWYKNVLSVARHKQIDFRRAIGNFDVQWENLNEASLQQTITKRYSHAACAHDNSMYVFGGCTCTSTTFNDLWRLDLSSRQWERLLTMGSYPSPKACSSLVYYKKSLILFGGWTHPSPYPLHQAWRTFNELHIYDIETNRWNCVTSLSSVPPSMAGHAATIHGDSMVVFGGLHGHNGGSNELWCLNLINHTWTKKETLGEKPHPRYGHSQIAIDENHLLILGGWGGPPNMVMSDVWLLTMTGRIWSWTKIQVDNKQWAATHLWCHPACKVDDFVVVLSRNPVSSLPSLAYTRWTSNSQIGIRVRRNDPNEGRGGLAGRGVEASGSSNPVDRDIHVNGHRGHIPSRSNNVAHGAAELQQQPSSSSNNRNVVPFKPNTPSNTFANAMYAFRKPHTIGNPRLREKQLDALKKMEDKLKLAHKFFKPDRPSAPKMAMFVLDISNILEDSKRASWLPLKSVALGSPESTILYTLVKGKGELIMFGGIQKDASTITSQEGQAIDSTDTVSNSLYFISAPPSII